MATMRAATTPSKVIGLIGASSGIGAATARRLAADGHRVVLGARRGEVIATIRDEIVAAGGMAIAETVDVRDPEDLQRLVDRAVTEFGRLDVLVASAGVATTAPLADGKLADWNAMIDVNLRGVLHGIRAALPVFRAQHDGLFVTVTSTAAAKWVPDQGVYAATKAGVRALCEVLRQEVLPDIRVSMICPGATDTAFTTDPALRARLSEIAMDPAAVADAIAYVVDQPAGLDVGEVVLRSARQP